MKFHFRTLGDGAPLILLHGLLGSLDNWQTLARRFAAHFKVFAVDQRNHGHSPHSEDIGFEAMAADLHEFMHAQGLSRAHVLGHSMGGKTAMQFALRHPGCVGKLVVVDMAPRAYPPRHARTLEALLALDLHAFDRRDQLDAELGQNRSRTQSCASSCSRTWAVTQPARSAGRPMCAGLWENYDRLTAAVPGDAPFPRRRPVRARRTVGLHQRRGRTVDVDPAGGQHHSPRRPRTMPRTEIRGTVRHLGARR